MRQALKSPFIRGPYDSNRACNALKTACIFLLPFLLTVFWVSAAPAQDSGKDLEAFYQENCSKCHGTDGSGLDRDGEKLSGRDLTDSEWQKETKDEEMVETILGGKFFGWAMPGFEDKLTPDQAQKMVTDIIRKSEKGKKIGSE
jgi:mono/diheme cytochrome c family protein